LKWLEKAIQRGNENYPWFESDPNWSALHDDPRFLELMDQIKARRETREAQTA
jgi:hypothetical protein